MKFINELAWDKMNGLLPAIVQDAETGSVLMLGYMNQEALQKTIETKWVTFFSRSKKCLWTKGDTSGNKLELVNVFPDCDNDTLLIFANPAGPTCHKDTMSCFSFTDRSQTDWGFIQTLEKVIDEREQSRPDNSYIASLFNSGTSRIVQKVGEEAIEVVLAAMEKNDAVFCGEVADLLFHILVLLKAKKLNLSKVIKVLKERR
ncbi:MAG TPA: bifunctional phosphoribosyl-AMP cyclohydrolase/phosphoribosyl-ATP diphosphatase HisIE [Gammaproteobacteria bacterium]|nr:bifunctional phosphoribosyl-AMP cyclohydrolase/phosphoribosyl-ATP diphosphatase HisIE [Gammaproteobacteria bacterium]